MLCHERVERVLIFAAHVGQCDVLLCKFINAFCKLALLLAPLERHLAVGILGRDALQALLRRLDTRAKRRKSGHKQTEIFK